MKGELGSIDQASPQDVRNALPPDQTAGIRRLLKEGMRDRSETLVKLAKQAKDKGYPREARIISADAQAIEVLIIPELEPRQVELLGKSDAELRAGMAERILKELKRKHLEGPALTQDGSLRDDVALTDAADSIAWAVWQFGERMYAAGFATCRAEMQADPLRWQEHVLGHFRPGEYVEGED